MIDIKEIAVWIKDYGYSVSVEAENGDRQNFVVFDNRTNKQNENSPDFKLIKSKPKDEREAF